MSRRVNNLVLEQQKHSTGQAANVIKTRAPLHRSIMELMESLWFPPPLWNQLLDAPELLSVGPGCSGRQPRPQPGPGVMGRGCFCPGSSFLASTSSLPGPVLIILLLNAFIPHDTLTREPHITRAMIWG